MGRISPTPDEGRALPVLPAVTLLTLNREGHLYAFIYTDQTQAEAMRWAGRHAANPELNFTWPDAAMITQGARDMARKGAL